jgi:membrane protein implicated in regulation of membrane protease activity
MMGTDVLEFIYLVCFFLGLGFAVLSALLAGVFGGHAGPHVDAGGVHVDLAASHTDGMHGPATDGTVHFSPLSPVSIALFITTFGGIGLLLKKFGLPPFVQLSAGMVSGILVGGAVSYAFFRVMQVTQASSHARAGEEIGIEAEVTVPIPNEGLGEIAYVVRGTRFTNPARTVDGKELPAHVTVKIVKQAGNTYYVQKA